MKNMDLLQKTIDNFSEEAAKCLDNCVMDAMEKGIDLHEIVIYQWIETHNNVITFHCRAEKLIDTTTT